MKLVVVAAVCALLLSVALTASAADSELLAGHAKYCPGSSSTVHASCSLNVQLAESCPLVMEEARARIQGEPCWVDPHNNGTYKLTNEASSSARGAFEGVLDGQRRTGDGRYTDKFRLTLNTIGSGCSVHACSESQVFSILDFNTNYCNLFNLVCGSGEGCTPVKHDLTLTHETIESCRSHDKKACDTTKHSTATLASTTACDTAQAQHSTTKRRILQQDINKSCPAVTTQSKFDLKKYISKPWFVQQQMATQYLPESWNYCVQAKYEMRKTQGLWGWSIQVRNYAEEKDGTVHQTGDTLCADGASTNDPAKLQVAPCFLPKIPGLTTGPYWILEYSEAEGYALISGGQPTEWTTNGCRTDSGRGTGTTSGAGLWIFTREQARDEKLVEKVRGLASDQGFDVSVLKDVSQTGCPVAV